MLLIAGAAVTVDRSGRSVPTSTAPATPSTHVLVRPDASTVAVAGTFNQWSMSSHGLSQDPSSGAWTTLVPLPPGEYLFMYIVDGTQWLSPPAAEDYIDDGFGAWNGVLVVR